MLQDSLSEPVPMKESSWMTVLHVVQVVATGVALVIAGVWVHGMGPGEQTPAAPNAVRQRVSRSTEDGLLARHARAYNPPTIFIVATEEEAGEIRQALGDGNTDIAALGLPMFKYEVVVAPMAEKPANIVVRYAEMVGGWSQVPQAAVRISDLRGE